MARGFAPGLIEIDATELRLRAERRLGIMLTEAKRTGQISPGQPPKNGSDKEPFFGVRLEDAGIDRKLSSRAQRIGGIGEQAFEAMVLFAARHQHRRADPHRRRHCAFRRAVLPHRRPDYRRHERDNEGKSQGRPHPYIGHRMWNFR
jgi:hypothetical protein